jgi:hypothetical protein|tara:strand:- start:934 stop:1134 length:201 start_codon:yes stop_codon:yes gene_type:complete
MGKVKEYLNEITDCVICDEPISSDPYGWSGGANAEPIASGRCCYDCDASVVIPYRILQAYSTNKGS